jgi:hypothetical protein
MGLAVGTRRESARKSGSKAKNSASVSTTAQVIAAFRREISRGAAGRRWFETAGNIELPFPTVRAGGSFPPDDFESSERQSQHIVDVQRAEQINEEVADRSDAKGASNEVRT